MNPEKLRGEYGKLAYLLQDALSPSLRRHLNIEISGDLNTVYSLLEEKNGLKYVCSLPPSLLPSLPPSRSVLTALDKAGGNSLSPLPSPSPLLLRLDQ